MPYQAPIEGPRLIRFGCHDTGQNLPRAASPEKGEEGFLQRFEKAYFAAELTHRHRDRGFALGREFGPEGYGRADLLFLAWSTSPSEQGFAAMALKDRLCITAIEAKLKDWRKGLMQAARYRAFANRSLLVVPPDTARVALAYLPTFKTLGVGLWAFAPDTLTLRRHFTPRPATAMIPRARDKALHLIGLRLQLG